MAIEFSLPAWFDAHVHLRQEELLPLTIGDQLKSGCAGVVAMPNTKPPTAKVLASDPLNYASLADYRQQVLSHGGDRFEQVIVPLYLTKETTVDMISSGVESGLLVACKYYPPHGTTNADHGASLEALESQGVFAAMQDAGVILCVHGEAHRLSGASYFNRSDNAETRFYQDYLPRLRDQYPRLKIICEHITTEVAVDFVKSSDASMVSATVTPQHLLYTIGDLLQGLNPHLYCLPVLKFIDDRDALRAAVIDPNNQQFFAGSDSAPHTKKATECGCAAGCYTAPVAPQLYVQAFVEAGLDLCKSVSQKILQRFLSELGPIFYGLPISTRQMTLSNVLTGVSATENPTGDLVPLPLALNRLQPTTIDWCVKVDA